MNTKSNKTNCPERCIHCPVGLKGENALDYDQTEAFGNWLANETELLNAALSRANENLATPVFARDVVDFLRKCNISDQQWEELGFKKRKKNRRIW